jgi:hypothetical protein
MMDLTPVEEHESLLLKREDLFVLGRCNGSKLRACQYLIARAQASGKTRVISAASVLSPQSAMAATVARKFGMHCTVVACSKPSTAMTHPSLRIAAEAGARLEFVGVGYNPFLQRCARDMTAKDHDAWQLPYGIAMPAGSTREAIREFHSLVAGQTANIPDTVRTVVIPFGSGQTAAGVIMGLAEKPPAALERIILPDIGPDRQQWLLERLSVLDVKPPVPVEHVALHPSFCTYGDRMPETVDGVIMHATYEGKIIRWAKQYQPDWWTQRDGGTLLWVVGGPLAA